jgi:hypothetical protein
MFNTFHLFDPSSFLFFIFVFPLFGIFLLLFIPNSDFFKLHLVALFTSLITFVSSLFL